MAYLDLTGLGYFKDELVSDTLSQSGRAADAKAAGEAIYDSLPTDTASGSIASFSDGANGVPVEALTVSLEPVQDLNGQSAPYPAGGGINLFPYLTPQTYGGVTVSVAEDGTITLDGTCTTSYNFLVNTTIENGAYSLCDFASGTFPDSNIRTSIYGTGIIFLSVSNTDASTAVKTATASASGEVECRIRVQQGHTYSNCKLRPMLVKGTVSSMSYAPYSNICPISGHTQCELWRAGVNVFDKDTMVVDGYIDNNSGVVKGTAPYKSSDFIRVTPSEPIYVKTDQTAADWGAWYDINKVYISGVRNYGNAVITPPSNAYYVRLTLATGSTGNIDTVSINYPSTDHDYHAHSIVNISIPLGQTVYGGVVDVVQGVLSVDRAMVTFDGNNSDFSVTTLSTYTQVSWIGYIGVGVAHDTFVSDTFQTVTINNDGLYKIAPSAVPRMFLGLPTSVTTVAEANAWFAQNPAQVAYHLATPITIPLADIPELVTLLGTNNIWSDSGNVSVEYRADIQRYIAKVIAEAIS